MLLKRMDFGTTPEGQDVRLWRISSENGLTAEITNIGACLVTLYARDARGQLKDVVLGLPCVADYACNPLFFGAVIGRNANRTAGARFELDGIHYELGVNESPNNNHSGPNMWHERVWDCVSASERHVTLALQSPDGDQGYPGAVAVRVTYEFVDANALAITYEGTPSAKTIMNLTNHSYFNLNGCDSGSALGHSLQVQASSYTECDERSIPTGRLLSVAGTPFDFSETRVLGEALSAPGAPAGGLDLNYAVWDYARASDGSVGILRRAATLVGDTSGIALDLWCDTPGVQVYSANFIEGASGKGGMTYHARDAVCLETQFFPDAIHHPEFEQPIFGPDRPYRSRTVFAFYCV